MKITVEMDCTPEEARAFLGLPDLKPMQQAVIERMQTRMNEAADAFSPELAAAHLDDPGARRAAADDDGELFGAFIPRTRGSEPPPPTSPAPPPP